MRASLRRSRKAGQIEDILSLKYPGDKLEASKF
jgi:hypothetical protein